MKSNFDQGLLFISVPSPVSNLVMTSNGSTNSLRVSWLPPAGHWESYHIQLLNQSSVVLNISVEKYVREYEIKDIGLIPGRLYEAVVIVKSGLQQNKAFCSARTGKKSMIKK